METANFRIVTDRPPPKIIAEVTIKALADSPINRVAPAPAPVPARRGRYLDVDAILARSLPKVVGEQPLVRVRSKEPEAA